MEIAEKKKKRMKKYCDERNIKSSEAIHLLAMEKLRDLYGCPPNLLQQVIEAAIRVNDKKK